jgi:hypothetical protein
LEFYIVSFRKTDFVHQEDVYFLEVENYFDFYYALGQPVYIHAAILYALIVLSLSEYCGEDICERAHLFSFLNKTVQNRVKDSRISFINVCSCVLFADILVFQYISGSLGVCHVPSSFGFLGCGGAFIYLPGHICKMQIQ